ncbi:hypothetical protein NL108_017378 [Boleophthalmus pectinirostris]|uniref:cystatin-A1-like n=1 Tax=Boleophthalmus pectinirostris TaxID=150288 RepID=UPI0024325FAA|nr:cystatin-A1-like [Boleophthalmus pectinirostris]KAJ0039349.1 hypothetical protein NL108_017378 [Boleophthalmus pectinirostris]
MSGGITNPRPADAGVQSICLSMKSAVEKNRGENFGIFEALSYKTKSDDGTTYYIEVFTGGDKYLEVEVFVKFTFGSGAVLTKVCEIIKTKEPELLNNAPT